MFGVLIVIFIKRNSNLKMADPPSKDDLKVVLTGVTML